MAEPSKAKTVTGVTLAAVLAVGAVVVAKWEGTKTTGYADVIGIATACTGHTGPGVVVGQRYTRAQCEKWLTEDLRSAGEAVDRCVTVPMTVNQWASFLSVTYNIGSAAFCRSSMARKANAGDWKGACAALSLYVYAGGRRIQGLANRRADERRLCESP